MFSHYKPMADNDAPRAWPIWTPGSLMAGIIKGLTKHCFTQNIKALGLMVSEVSEDGMMESQNFGQTENCFLRRV